MSWNPIFSPRLYFQIIGSCFASEGTLTTEKTLSDSLTLEIGIKLHRKLCVTHHSHTIRKVSYARRIEVLGARMHGIWMDLVQGLDCRGRWKIWWDFWKVFVSLSLSVFPLLLHRYQPSTKRYESAKHSGHVYECTNSKLNWHLNDFFLIFKLSKYLVRIECYSKCLLWWYSKCQ